MRQAFGGGGFLGLTNTLRSLTAASPISTAVQEAHRMARRRLEAGGAAAASAPERGDIVDAGASADAREAGRAELADGEQVEAVSRRPQKELTNRAQFALNFRTCWS